MTIQEIIIDRITEKYSRLGFMNKLRKMKLQCSSGDMDLIDNLLLYYSVLFDRTIDHHSDIIRFAPLRKRIRSLFVSKLNDNDENCDTKFLAFFIDLIDFGDDFVKGVKLLKKVS